jgi:polyferredoxin
MPTLEQLALEIETIKERNKRVEVDKAWETSWARRVLILVLTYFVVLIFFLVAGVSKPFINAIVPSLAFVLSTLTVPVFKKWWVKKNKKYV